MSYRKSIPIIICWCLSTTLSAQTSEIDSLKHLLASVQDNSYEKGDLLLKISNAYRYTDTAICKMYIREALQLAQKIESDRLEREVYWTLGIYYHYGDVQPYLAYFYYKKAEKLLLNADEKIRLCGLYTNLMSQFYQIDDMDNVAYYAQKILEIAAEWYDLPTLTPLDTNMPQTWYDMETLILGAQIFEGVALYKDNTSNEALDFFERMFKKAILLKNDYNYSNFVADCCVEIYFQQDRPREALYYLHWMRENVETKQTSGLMPGSYALLARAYAMLHQTDSAEFFIKKAWDCPVISYQVRLSLFQCQSIVEANKGNYRSALENFKKYHHISDSIAKSGKTTEIARMKNWYELEQKDHENEILQQEKQKQQKLILILAAALALIFALLALSILLYRKTDEKNSELKKLHTVKDKLFSVVAHDLRSPMGALISILKLTNKDMLDAETQTQLLKDITGRVDETYGLLENLLRWAKSQMQGIIPSPVHFNAQDVSLTVTDAIQYIASNKGIILNNNIEEQQVYADCDMFAVVVRNLSMNAIKYSSYEGEVTLSSKSSGNMLEISVKDTGTGMSQEVQNKLFNLSETKSQRGTGNESGTGLGLVLCADFVKINGGSIWFTSKEGEGSTFSFTVPVKELRMEN